MAPKKKAKPRRKAARASKKVAKKKAAPRKVAKRKVSPKKKAARKPVRKAAKKPTRKAAPRKAAPKKAAKKIASKKTSTLRPSGVKTNIKSKPEPKPVKQPNARPVEEDKPVVPQSEPEAKAPIESEELVEAEPGNQDDRDNGKPLM